MPKPLFTINVEVPAEPRAVYFIKNAKAKKGEPGLVEVTHRVRRLAVVQAKAGCNGDDPHYLRRLDVNFKLVWETRHASLQETLWHAEWEYEVQEADWEKVG